MSDQKQQDERETSSNQQGRSIAEWTTLAISTAILVALLGGVTWLMFRGANEPATIAVEPQMDQLREAESGYYLPVIIRNEGDTTAANVVAHGELDTGSGQPETADVTIEFLDGDEQVAGTFVFRSDPRSGDLSVGVTSFEEP